MTPTFFEIIMYTVFGGLAFVGIVIGIAIYIYTESRTYKHNRLHPERYGSIDTHYWC